MSNQQPRQQRRLNRSARRAAIILGCIGLLLGRQLDASAPTVTPLDLELDGPGQNVDDPCFWVDGSNPQNSLVFVTAKDSGLVEVFNAVSGAPVGTVPGFGLPNNCVVDGDLLLTTDAEAGMVRIHHLPDLAPVRTFGEDMTTPEGIDVLNAAGSPPLVYVTDSSDASVHVYDLATSALVRSFPTGFGAGIEPVLADDRQQRIFVPRGEKELTRGVGVFTPEGTLLREFGAAIFSKDAEGMAIYACGDGGYLIIADQVTTATQFEVYDRTSLEHIGTFTMQDASGDATNSTDGIDLLQTPLPGFPNGMLAACDGCGSTLPDEMDVVAWERIATTLGLNLCPGGAAPDCTTTPCVERLVATADATVDGQFPDTNFGGQPTLEIEYQPPTEITETLLRFEVPDLTGFDVLGARVRLTVARQSGSDSDDGGTLYAASSQWTEGTVTFNTRPARAGSPFGSAGPVTTAQAVEFDVLPAVPAGGTYDFVLASSSINRGRYRSREASESPPALLVTLHASNAPTIGITSPPTGTTVLVGTAVTLAATASDTEDGDLSGKMAWESSLDGALGTGAALTLSSLGVGTHTITARVVDGAGLAASASVELSVERVPTVTITSPASGASAPAGAPVVLAGTAVDARDGDLGASLRWTSDRDGLLGTGDTLTVALSEGTHLITAAAVNTAGGLGHAEVQIVIGPSAPRVRILAPGEGAATVAGTAVPLVGRAVDVTDGDLSHALTWASDLQGPLGSGASATVSGLTAGTHVITARVTDASGLGGEATVKLRVSPATLELEPQADAYVASDLPGNNYGTAETLQADASPERQAFLRFAVTDTAGLAIDQALVRLVVSSASASESASGGTLFAISATGWGESQLTYDTRPPIDGPALGTKGAVARGAAVEFDATSAVAGDGPVAFALRTASSDAVKYKSRETASGRPKLVLRLGATPAADLAPAVLTTRPTNGSVVPPAVPVTLTASASDAEDGDLSAAVVWTSSLAGPLGAGSAVTVPGLEAGMHTISARATDSAGHTATETITLFVGTPPTLAILSPADGAAIAPGATVTLRASAADREDGDLGAAVTWSSDRDGALGTGTMLVAPGLSAGSHAITAAVTDTSGIETRASIRISVRPGTLAIAPSADTYVSSSSPTKNYGLATLLTADASPDRQILLRFTVTGAGPLPPDRAVLRLTVANVTGAGANRGGTVHRISDTGWKETTLTYTSRPPLDGPALASAGAVGLGAVVDLDLTGAIGGDGTYVLALVTSSSDGVSYVSREGGAGAPQLLLTNNVLPSNVPELAITAPADGGSVPFGVPLTLGATASDPEEGDLSGAVEWSSDLDGPLGSGASISVTTLSLGTHVITATVADSASNTATATITLVVELASGVLALAPVADVTVQSDTPDRSLGLAATLTADASPERQAFLRFAVTGMAGRTAERAILRLTVASVSGAPSNRGGTIHALSDDGWDEATVSWTTRPVIDGPALATAGAVAAGDIVEFDVAGAIVGDGAVVLALVTSSTDGVTYVSREGAAGAPQLLITTVPAPLATALEASVQTAPPTSEPRLAAARARDAIGIHGAPQAGADPMFGGRPEVRAD